MPVSQANCTCCEDRCDEGMVAKRFGTMACAACLILAIVELVSGAHLGPRPWVPLWTVWVGIVISPLELPVLKECYQCVDCNKSNTSWCTEWEKFMLVTLRLKNWYLRGLFYALVSPTPPTAPPAPSRVRRATQLTLATQCPPLPTSCRS